MNKLWACNTHNSEDELQKHYVEQKKPDTEDDTVYHLPFVWNSRRDNISLWGQILEWCLEEGMIAH